MEELIKITEKDGKKAVSARELYNFLEVETPFNKWIKRMLAYGFNENVDWTKMSSENQLIEYVLSLDCAKEISMLQRTEKGKQARMYFIECEKQLNSNMAVLSEVQLLLKSVQLSVSNTKAIEVIEKKIASIEQKQLIEIKQDYFTILAFCKRNNIHLNFSEAIKKGKIATKLSKEKGLDLRQVDDEKFGYVNSYKYEILK